MIDGNVMERNDYYTFGKRHTSGRSYSSLASSPFLFSGKEDQSLAKRIADQDATASAKLNFLNFGARHYDPVVPRWLTVDPLSEKYYNLNPYLYCAADPVNIYDPDGRDGLYITFPRYKANGYPFTGHAGVLLIDNKTGYTRYYEYGRYNNDTQGIVRSYSVPNVDMKNGMPTAESLKRVMSKISQKSGKGEELEGAYIKSDSFDAMNNYAREKLSENNDKNRAPYNIFYNNCGTFAHDVIKQDESVNTPTILDPRPVSIIDEYRKIFTPVNFHPKEGTTINGKEQTTVFNNRENTTEIKQNWWQTLWYKSK